jgi:hypothetical protein
LLNLDFESLLQGQPFQLSAENCGLLRLVAGKTFDQVISLDDMSAGVFLKKAEDKERSDAATVFEVQLSPLVCNAIAGRQHEAPCSHKYAGSSTPTREPGSSH